VRTPSSYKRRRYRQVNLVTADALTGIAFGC
jgi:hypothetical protein